MYNNGDLHSHFPKIKEKNIAKIEKKKRKTSLPFISAGVGRGEMTNITRDISLITSSTIVT
jgi:hypothetical protein